MPISSLSSGFCSLSKKLYNTGSLDIDSKYLTLLQHDLNQPMSKIELLTLGATRCQVEDKEFLVVKLPFHTDNPFIFYKENNGNYYKW